MRVISIVGFTIGLLVGGYSVWRWGGWLYDEPFRMLVGIFIGISIIGFSYIIDWMTLRDKIDRVRNEKMDSAIQEVKSIRGLLKKMKGGKK